MKDDNDEPEKRDEAVFGSAQFEFNFGEGKEVPTAVFLVVGLLMVSVCVAVFTYTEGFGATDESGAGPFTTGICPCASSAISAYHQKCD